MELSCRYVMCEISGEWGMLSLVFREGVWATDRVRITVLASDRTASFHNTAPHAGGPNHTGVLGL